MIFYSFSLPLVDFKKLRFSEVEGIQTYVRKIVISRFVSDSEILKPLRIFHRDSR